MSDQAGLAMAVEVGGLRILFASMAADGHFNPLTGIAVHLKEAGHDVRWYTGPSYARKLERLGIPHFPFRRATDINGENIAELFPERARLKGPALIRFDGEKVFVSNTEKYFEDVREIDSQFPFDLLVCDAAFSAVRLIKEKLDKRVATVSPIPSLESSDDVPPNFVGFRPARTPIGRLVHRGMRAAMDRLAISGSTAIYNGMLAAHGVPPIKWSFVDEFFRSPDVVFLSGVPGFDWPRRDPNPKARFVGALLPHRAAVTHAFAQPASLDRYERVILISQGTVDNRDPGKLITPALDALKDSGALLIVGTGHSQTEELRRSYPQENVVIEDYVDFPSILERADLFICNGGYGSVLLSLSKGVPLLVAGVREGKNDINARVDYFGVGIDLRTERPKAEAIRRATERLLGDPVFKQNAGRLRDEFSRYRPNELIDAYLEGMFQQGKGSTAVSPG
jgi:UDP:flavonoid glycosyltransferase YjiC (YdhE family)